MYAYELLPKLIYLNLWVENDEDYWEERVKFIGTFKQHHDAARLEEILSLQHEI